MKLSSSRRARPTLKMHRFLPSFVLTAAALLLASAATPLRAQSSNDGLLPRGPHGTRPPQPQQSAPQKPVPQQSALPPTRPTTLPTPTPVPTPKPAPTPTPTAPTEAAKVLNAPPPHRAFVVFANGQLEVRADNSSLLQILHDIYRLTGMTISGGVTEQHIFGDYGPASPSTVLATLLDGTGTNMLLRQDPVTGAPVELVLSQRAGGGSPTSPIGPGFDDSPFPAESSLPLHPGQPTPPTNTPGQSQPATNASGITTNQPQTASTVNAVPVSTPASTPTPVKGAPATPESIYQQLLQMQQARAKATPTGSSPATTAPATPTTNQPPQ